MCPELCAIYARSSAIPILANQKTIHSHPIYPIKKTYITPMNPDQQPSSLTDSNAATASLWGRQGLV